MRRRALILSACAVMGFLAAPPTAYGGDPDDARWGPFRGRFFDSDTGQPIPGAFAIVIWLERGPMSHSAEKFYDARAGVADLDGAYEVPRRSVPFFSNRILEPMIEYFAPGYARMEPFEERDGVTVVRLRQWSTLSREERLRYRGMGEAGRIPQDTVQALIQTINVERERLGLRPVRSIGGVPR